MNMYPLKNQHCAEKTETSGNAQDTEQEQDHGNDDRTGAPGTWIMEMISRFPSARKRDEKKISAAFFFFLFFLSPPRRGGAVGIEPVLAVERLDDGVGLLLRLLLPLLFFLFPLE